MGKSEKPYQIFRLVGKPSFQENRAEFREKGKHPQVGGHGKFVLMNSPFQKLSCCHAQRVNFSGWSCKNKSTVSARVGSARAAGSMGHKISIVNGITERKKNNDTYQGETRSVHGES
jgi:hypothetical protein